MEPRILIIYTGGTIGMIEDSDTGVLRPFDFTHLMENVPKVKMLNYHIDNLQFNPPIDSSDMDLSHWQQIVRAIAENYDSYDGFVVLHGTDTMSYTASALSFLLEDLSKPVIITGSQLPIGEVRTDGEENLITALQIAAARDRDGSPMVQEVAILFENYLWRGNRSTKRSADNFNAFRSNNYPELAKIGLGINFDYDALARGNAGKPLVPHYDMSSCIIPIDLYPGLRKETLYHLLEAPGLRGIVLRTYGAGNSPTTPWFLEWVKDAIARGIIMLNVTQCINGGVNTTRYVSADLLNELGVISGHDITFEAAITKMMYIFGQGYSDSEIRRLLASPLCGEMTPVDEDPFASGNH